eukprot:Pgem_evm1s15651
MASSTNSSTLNLLKKVITQRSRENLNDALNFDDQSNNNTDTETDSESGYIPSPPCYFDDLSLDTIGSMDIPTDEEDTNNKRSVTSNSSRSSA